LITLSLQAALVQALKNTSRHTRRSLVAIGAVGFGLVAMLLAAGFIDDIKIGMREATIRSQLGHVQVTRPNYLAAGLSAPFDYLLPETSPEKEIAEHSPHVSLLAPRLSFNGLISHGETTMSFFADGVSPDREAKLSNQLSIIAGANLDDAHPKTAILGYGLAKSLGVKVGDKVVLVASMQRGGVSAVEVVVRGIFGSYSKAYDDVAIRLPIVTAQQLLRVKGAHRWVLLVDKTEHSEAVAEELKRSLGKGFEVTHWSQLADFYNKTVSLFSRQVGVMKFIIAMIIVLSISNTMIMSVMERTGDIGTTMALGVSRQDVLLGFLLEGLFLGVGGSVVGVVLGIASAAAVSYFGIPMPPPPGGTVGYTAAITVSPSLVIQAISLGLVTTLVASAYPAWKASRMIIVDALRHNR
jgi:putative ABC transport system permease protein